MLKKVGISLMAAMMMSSVAFASNFSLSYDEYLECCFSLVDNEKNIQESKQEERKVLKFNKEVVKKIMKEEGYLPSSAESTIVRIIELDVRLQNVLDTYLSDQSISTESVNGISLNMVKEKFPTYDFWSLLIMVDKYANYPDGVERLKKVNRLNENWADYMEKHIK